ncbi:MAG: PilC/PilY family type IV pilus protein, partial [Pseudomonadota bacterium]
DGDTAIWEAGAELASMGSGSRHIYTFMTSQAQKKQTFSSSNAALKTQLASQWEEDQTETGDIIEFIRGNTANDGIKYRTRDGWILGDIAYSTPMYVGPSKFYYSEHNYQAFKTSNATRTPIIYVGANDGMLHAFRASNGSEEWAFIPENIQPNLKSLTTSDCHSYFVDLPPIAADIYDGSIWRTILIGGNRFGGEEYFCLDITNPSHDQFIALWDTIPFSDRKSSIAPFVGKMKGNGIDKWLAIISSGYHEGTSAGKIAALNFSDGAKEQIWHDGTNYADELTTQPKGADSPYYTLSSPVGVDSDLDGYLDLIYAGDTEGSLWKFYYDYVSQVWKKVEIFQTNGEPITARPTLAFDKPVCDVEAKLRIYFGTGKYSVQGDKADETQGAFYCLVETRVTTGDANNGHYTSITPLLKNSDLKDVTTIVTNSAFGLLSEDEREKIENKGWYFNLDQPSGPAERVISEGVVISEVVFFTSFVPNSDVCGYGGTSRLYAVDFQTSLPASNNNSPVLDGIDDDERYKELGEGLPSKPIYYFDKTNKESELLVQTSDTNFHEETINVEGRPIAVKSWRNW